ncbi:lipid II:glycine glycyltransferase FemX [Haladaptatus sp. DYSN1]|uniref:lipid II:glycine glycyltransferase FemX n=1 Tax=unclassified Haladaptatus TaxID=2622732 RepID=UPI002404AE25|nr:GNAT family N-acetyltransferase [Haladaptatus sp. DYSN1]
MTVQVELASIADQQRWNDYVAASPQGTFFHQLEVLDVLAAHSRTTLELLVGRKGEEVVGLFPVFVKSVFGLTVAFSPPAGLKIPYLGPVLLNSSHLRQRTLEARHQEFVDGCLEYLEETVRSRYLNIRSAVGYEDIRPYIWHGFDILPRYTYHVDLTGGKDHLLAQFSGDARTNIRKAEANEATVTVGGEDAIERIITQVKARHVEQDKRFEVTPELVMELYRRLPAGSVLPYEAHVDGTYAGGNIVVSFGDTICVWLGGATPGLDVPVNDLLDWKIMADGVENGLTWYDFAGANVQQINQYKSKFNPVLRPYFNIERASQEMAVVAGIYKLLS